MPCGYGVTGGVLEEAGGRDGLQGHLRVLSVTTDGQFWEGETYRLEKAAPSTSKLLQRALGWDVVSHVTAVTSGGQELLPAGMATSGRGQALEEQAVLTARLCLQLQHSLQNSSSH